MSNVFQNLNWSALTNILVSILPALVCITLHEVSHGYVAYRLGDNTAKNMGRLTLNPIKHIDIMGLIMMVLFKFGWAKPVPVDMRNFRSPKRDMAITALAGPVSNLLITIVFLFLYGFFYPLNSDGFAGTVLQMIYTTAYISAALAIFNLVPIPPLDGSKVLFSLMSDEAYYKLMKYERYGMILLMVVLFSGIADNVLSNSVSFLMDKFWGIADFAYTLGSKIL